jgi:hypothetical protein
MQNIMRIERSTVPFTHQLIDTTFDFRSDVPKGKDPDQYSPTLRRYHKLLWSKALPNGKQFTLEVFPGGFLRHKSELGEFILAGDTANATFYGWKRLMHFLDKIPANEVEMFEHMVYTIAGNMIWPSNRIGKNLTINGARGFKAKIADRMDLTLECIRRFYAGQESPLFVDLNRYANFFSLFQDFGGYIEFFLMQDLVTDDYSRVRFFLPFDDFKGPSVPQNLEEYLGYRTATIAYLEARNSRIAQTINR